MSVAIEQVINVLERIEELSLDALDPALTREAVIEKMKSIYELAASDALDEEGSD